MSSGNGNNDSANSYAGCDEEGNVSIPSVNDEKNTANSIPSVSDEQNTANSISSVNDEQNTAKSIPSVNDEQNQSIPSVNDEQNQSIPSVNDEQNQSIPSVKDDDSIIKNLPSVSDDTPIPSVNDDNGIGSLLSSVNNENFINRISMYNHVNTEAAEVINNDGVTRIDKVDDNGINDIPPANPFMSFPTSSSYLTTAPVSGQNVNSMSIKQIFESEGDVAFSTDYCETKGGGSATSASETGFLKQESELQRVLRLKFRAIDGAINGENALMSKLLELQDVLWELFHTVHTNDGVKDSFESFPSPNLWEGKRLRKVATSVLWEFLSMEDQRIVLKTLPYMRPWAPISLEELEVKMQEEQKIVLEKVAASDVGSASSEKHPREKLKSVTFDDTSLETKSAEDETNTGDDTNSVSGKRIQSNTAEDPLLVVDERFLATAQHMSISKHTQKTSTGTSGVKTVTDADSVMDHHDYRNNRSGRCGTKLSTITEVTEMSFGTTELENYYQQQKVAKSNHDGLQSRYDLQSGLYHTSLRDQHQENFECSSNQTLQGSAAATANVMQYEQLGVMGPRQHYGGQYGGGIQMQMSQFTQQQSQIPVQQFMHQQFMHQRFMQQPMQMAPPQNMTLLHQPAMQLMTANNFVNNAVNNSVLQNFPGNGLVLRPNSRSRTPGMNAKVFGSGIVLRPNAEWIRKQESLGEPQQGEKKRHQDEDEQLTNSIKFSTKFEEKRHPVHMSLDELIQEQQEQRKQENIGGKKRRKKQQ